MRGRRRLARPARRAVLLVCEGKQTEPRYFTALVRTLGLAATVDVEVRGDTGYTDPQGLVKAAITLRRERERLAKIDLTKAAFEDVWVVFDVEHPTNGRTPQIPGAVTSARTKDIHPAISRPSFEIWYLLHDRATPPGVTCSAEAITHLKGCIGEYAKDQETAERVALWALPRTGIALAHGHRQDVFAGADPSPGAHVPGAVGTAVHRLVQALVDMSSDDAGKRKLGIAGPLPQLDGTTTRRPR